MRTETTWGRLAFGRVTSQPEVQVILRPATLLAGRVLLSAIFILSGIMKLVEWQSTLDFVETRGLPAAPVMLALAAIVEIGAGLSVLTGTLTRVGALILFLYLIPTTLIFHDFWSLAGAERQMQLVNFMKNSSIMGGLLAVIGCGAGRFSVDRNLERIRTPAAPA